MTAPALPERIGASMRPTPRPLTAPTTPPCAAATAARPSSALAAGASWLDLLTMNVLTTAVILAVAAWDTRRTRAAARTIST